MKQAVALGVYLDTTILHSGNEWKWHDTQGDQNVRQHWSFRRCLKVFRVRKTLERTFTTFNSTGLAAHDIMMDLHYNMLPRHRPDQ